MTTADTSREVRLVETFVKLTDTLVKGFDVIDLFEGLVDGCTELLPVSSAGLMMADLRGHLHVMAASNEATRLLELLELQHEEGPCLEAFLSQTPVGAPDLAAQSQRWPRFVPEATAQGFTGAYALPMRFRADTMGALNLFCDSVDALTQDDLRVGQALADAATVAVISDRTISRETSLVEELQTALNSRVTLEQAKGVVAASLNIGMSEAFGLLRNSARSNNRPLSEVAASVIHGRIEPAWLVATRFSAPSSPPTA
jgi:ANTAR domain-containing protein/GAF domain-containing protein